MDNLKTPSGLSSNVAMRTEEKLPYSDTIIDFVKEGLQNENIFYFRARGRSMMPFIRHGDTIGISGFIPEEIETGDVVALYDKTCNRIVGHRIINYRDQKLVLKGDNEKEVDGVFLEKDILGKVVKVVRNDKNVYFGNGLEKSFIVFFSRLHHRFWQAIRIAGRFLQNNNRG